VTHVNTYKGGRLGQYDTRRCRGNDEHMGGKEPGVSGVSAADASTWVSSILFAKVHPCHLVHDSIEGSRVLGIGG
jgi:hypothetical protein